MNRRQKGRNSAKKKDKSFETGIDIALKTYQSKDYLNAYQELNQLISVKPERADLIHLAGICLLYLNDTKNAQSYFERAWALDKENLDYVNSLADIACRNGQYDEAIKLYRLILERNPKYIHGLNQLGVLHQLQGKNELAAGYFQKALELDPTHTAYNSIGTMLFQVKYYDQAKYYFEKAEKLDPENPQYKQNLASVYFLQGNPERSFEYLLKVLALDSENARAMIQLGQILRENNVRIAQYSRNDQDVIGNILNNRNVEHLRFSALWLDLVLLNPENKILNELLQCATYEELRKNIDYEALLPVLADEFFGLGLRFLIVNTLPLENFLIRIRHFLLECYREDGFNQFTSSQRKQVIRFLCALGEQCFINEYVYPETGLEKETISTLVETLSKRNTYDDVLEEVAMLSTYCSLYRLPFVSALLEKFKSEEGLPDHFLNLLELQLFEPLLEEEIKKDIPALGSINNEVSVKVREQYEENPYPRWRSIGVVQNLNPVQARAEIDILIAGCGSGRQTILTSNDYPAATITAVDLSRTSLAYSIRKSREYGVDMKVRHLQADILDPGLLDKQYDLIMCSGVLHHMEKPEDGLKVLKGLLKPGGAMNIGLYSEIAREQIVKAIKEVKKENIAPTREGISSFREGIKAQSESHGSKQLLGMNDFYTTSACRDLLFHVQEHRFTFLTLKDFLDSCDLRFLRFSVNLGNYFSEFKKMYVDPEDIYDLAKWHEFEKKHQQAFLGMYQIWACHKEDWDQLRVSAPLIS